MRATPATPSTKNGTNAGRKQLDRTRNHVYVFRVKGVPRPGRGSSRRGGGWPRFLISPTSPTRGCPVLRAVCEGRESGMPAQVCYPCRVITNQIAHAASPPTLAKTARMGHPLSKWCTQTITKGGPPAGLTRCQPRHFARISTPNKPVPSSSKLAGSGTVVICKLLNSQ